MPVSPAGIPGNANFTWLSVNYAPIALGGTLVLVGGWWLLSAHKWFKGPSCRGTEEELARIEAQYGERVAPAADARVVDSTESGEPVHTGSPDLKPC